MEPLLSPAWHGTGGVPNNGDFIFALGDAQGALTLPIVPIRADAERWPYYVRDLTNTGIGRLGQHSLDV